MTGAIEPFYYPQKREGLFNRTMFISTGKAALTASLFSAISDKAVASIMERASIENRNEIERYFISRRKDF